MNYRVAFTTLGCKVNQYETQAMIEIFSQAGFEITDFNGEADVYIINSCSVTHEGERKSLQLVRRARTKSPEAIVAFVGCCPESLVNTDGVEADIIMGAKNRKMLLPAVLEHLRNRVDGQVFNEWETSALTDGVNNFEDLRISGSHERTRVNVKVQDGCNSFCSYCIIPYNRGRARSRPIEDALGEITCLTERGYKEIVFVGIHLSSYGIDIGLELTELIERAGKIKGLTRLRLGSLEPKYMTEEVIKRMSEVETLCPHFHLSLQSGCDETLRRMNRKYSTEEYKNTVGNIRRYFTNAAITTDIIVGFPGENETEFEKSYKFVESIEFAKSHVFIYSKRTGTAAVSMPNQVSKQNKEARSKIMLELSRRDSEKFLKSQVGKTMPVLFESKGEGMTANYLTVRVELEEENPHNQIKDVYIYGCTDSFLLGRITN